MRGEAEAYLRVRALSAPAALVGTVAVGRVPRFAGYQDAAVGLRRREPGEPRAGPHLDLRVRARSRVRGGGRGRGDHRRGVDRRSRLLGAAGPRGAPAAARSRRRKNDGEGKNRDGRREAPKTRLGSRGSLVARRADTPERRSRLGGGDQASGGGVGVSAGADALAPSRAGARHRRGGGRRRGGAHQICIQVWWVTLFALDALAVAAQSLVAASLGAGDVPGALARRGQEPVLGARRRHRGGRRSARRGPGGSGALHGRRRAGAGGGAFAHLGRAASAAERRGVRGRRGAAGAADFEYLAVAMAAAATPALVSAGASSAAPPPADVAAGAGGGDVGGGAGGRLALHGAPAARARGDALVAVLVGKQGPVAVPGGGRGERERREKEKET